MSSYPYFTPQSDEQRMRHLARESEQARRDITNLQRRLFPELGDVIPGDDGTNTTGEFAIGTLDVSIARGETGKAFTVLSGNPLAVLVGDYSDQIPQYIAIPSATKLTVCKVGDNWSIIPPGWIYTLQGSLASAIAAQSTGSVSTDYGTLTSVANNTETDATTGWCMVTAKPNGSWVLSNFNPDCPA